MKCWTSVVSNDSCGDYASTGASWAATAARLFREEEHLTKKRPIDISEITTNPILAQEARAKALQLMEPPRSLAGRPNMELVERPEVDERLTPARMELLETLDQPNIVSVAASEQRAELSMRVGVLPLALDTVHSADAQGPIEKMLCNQMAGVHATGMELLAKIQETRNLPPVETARLSNAASRLFETFQGAATVLQRLRTGGTQRVIVQHQQQVHVEAGGQAMVAGRLEPGARRRRKLKNAK